MPSEDFSVVSSNCGIEGLEMETIFSLLFLLLLNFFFFCSLCFVDFYFLISALIEGPFCGRS